MTDTVSPQPRPMGAVNWIGLWTLYKREVWRFMKIYGQTITAPVVTTLLYCTIFALAFSNRAAMTAGIPLLEFLGPGLIMMSMVQNAFANTSTSIMISKYDGSIVDILMPPLSPMELTLGKILGGVSRGVVVGVVSTVTLMFFIPIGCHNPFFIVFHGIMGSMMLSTLGMIAGVWGDKFDHIAAITNFVVVPLTFLSGTFYSIEKLSPVWQMVTLYNPFFYMIDGFRYGFIGHADSNVVLGIFVMLGVNFVLWVACHRMIKTGYKIKS